MNVYTKSERSEMFRMAAKNRMIPPESYIKIKLTSEADSHLIIF